MWRLKSPWKIVAIFCTNPGLVYSVVAYPYKSLLDNQYFQEMLRHSRAWNNFLAAAGQVIRSNLSVESSKDLTGQAWNIILNRHCLLIFFYFKLCLLILVVCRIPAFCCSLKNLDGLWGNWAVTVNCLCALSGEAPDSNPARDTWWGCHLLAIWYFLVLSSQTNVTGGTSSQRICQTRNTKWKTRNYGAGNQDSSHCTNSQVCTYTQTIIQLTLPVIIVTVVAIIIIAIVIIIDIADHHNLHHHLNHHHHHHHHHIIVIIIITLSLHINLWLYQHHSNPHSLTRNTTYSISFHWNSPRWLDFLLFRPSQ